MKLVLDTNIWISATLWIGSVAQKLLYTLLRENHEIFVTKEIIEEYIRVLNKDFNIYDYNEYITIIQKSSTLIETKEKISICEDPDDNKILECAVDAKADYIITYDKHLLILKEFKKIKIIKPEEF